MKRYIDSMNRFLLTTNYDDTNTLLEMLYYSYTEENSIESDEIRCGFRKLDDILCRLTLEENNAVFGEVCSLCFAHERKAFLKGIHVGVRLFTELCDTV